MELNKTEDNKCCFLHFGRGVQDPLSGDQGGGGSLDPWTPPPLDPPQSCSPGIGLAYILQAEDILRRSEGKAEDVQIEWTEAEEYSNIDLDLSFA